MALRTLAGEANRCLQSVAEISKPNMLCQIDVRAAAEALMACVNIGISLFRTQLRQYSGAYAALANL
jgi:hypothetical protein